MLIVYLLCFTILLWIISFGVWISIPGLNSKITTQWPEILQHCQSMDGKLRNACAHNYGFCAAAQRRKMLTDGFVCLSELDNRAGPPIEDR